MKNYQLILLTTALFITLFYGESMGLNFGILAIGYALLTLFKTHAKNRNRNFLILFVTTVLSGVAFAWYGDFVSFLAVFVSAILLAFKSKSRDLKSLLAMPVFVANLITFPYRFFKFEEWLPMRKSSVNFQKLLSVVLIPAFFIIMFFAIYSAGSKHFAQFFTDFHFEFNFWEFFTLGCLGFFIAFNYWNFKIDRYVFGWNHDLKNDFLNEDKNLKSTYSFLDLDAERMSGVVSLFALNILLLVFIITFNYEQFVEIPKSPNQLSEDTHNRVNAVIFSILMAIGMIMFYFKGSFNFDKNAKSLKILAKTWIVLNVVLVLSAFLKNAEYVISYGLTYKRLGVYAFLILSVIGLILTFIKVQKQKTNAFLFNQMFWYFYGVILVCSFVNWGGIITSHNMERKDFAVNFHQVSIHFSERQLLKYASEKGDEKLRDEILKEAKSKQAKSFLSKVIYDETIK
ncbi:DUF4153 domain-containing protein [Chryseobacterium koreense]|uniref:DUF4153 domain-containing protein n=1 Tax=Chryseobacterium koreense TaxID=232216 RepID=UPI0026EF97A9|nr:DUF4173 domain-containing protein [Chryseobacterium koreense]